MLVLFWGILGFRMVIGLLFRFKLIFPPIAWIFTFTNHKMAAFDKITGLKAKHHFELNSIQDKITQWVICVEKQQTSNVLPMLYVDKWMNVIGNLSHFILSQSL